PPARTAPPASPLPSERSGALPDLHSFPTRRSSDLRRSGRRTRPAPVSTQSPQLRSPSEAVHGRSKAKRNTLTVATRSAAPHTGQDRKSTRLNSSHVSTSYAVFCLKKKKKSREDPAD